MPALAYLNYENNTTKYQVFPKKFAIPIKFWMLIFMKSLRPSMSHLENFEFCS